MCLIKLHVFRAVVQLKCCELVISTNRRKEKTLYPWLQNGPAWFPRKDPGKFLECCPSPLSEDFRKESMWWIIPLQWLEKLVFKTCKPCYLRKVKAGLALDSGLLGHCLYISFYSYGFPHKETELPQKNSRKSKRHLREKNCDSAWVNCGAVSEIWNLATCKTFEGIFQSVPPNQEIKREKNIFLNRK